MKKAKLLILMVIFQSSCVSKVIDPLSGCERDAEKFTAALTDFSSDFKNKKKCEAYKDATANYLKNCNTILGANRKDIQDAVNSIDCSKL